MVFGDKKGIWSSLFTIEVIMVLVIAGFFIVVGSIILNGFNNGIQASSVFDTDSKDIIQDRNDRFSGFWDNAFMFLFGGLVLAAWYGSYIFAENKAWLFLSVILLAVLIVVGANMSNLTEAILSNDSFVANANLFPKLYWVLTHLVEVIIGIAVGCFFIGNIGSGRGAEI